MSDLEEAALDEVENNPQSTTRKIARGLQMSHTVWEILKDQLLFSLHIQRIKVLIFNDFLAKYCLQTNREMLF